MKKNVLRPLILSGLLLTAAACTQNEADAKNTPKAATNVTQHITDTLENAYSRNGLQVREVSTTPVKGIFEVVLDGNEIVYTDESASYLFTGNLVDIKARTNLTEERLSDINRVDFAKLPFKDAIVEVRGKGERKVAVFSDPDCPFCRRLERTFANMDNLTIYTFLMPIPSLHPGAEDKAQTIWCQSNRTEAWTKWMRESKLPNHARCDNPVEKLMDLGQSLGFNGTPTIVFPNGVVTAGALPQNALERELNKNQK